MEAATAKVIVLVDYENIAEAALEDTKVIDFEGLATLCRGFGQVIENNLFVPIHRLSEAWFESARLQGFNLVATPSQVPGRHKQYKTADSVMIKHGNQLLSLAEITKLVIVSHDIDFIDLVNLAKDNGKTVILVAIQEKASRNLIQAVHEVYELPTHSLSFSR